jgi:hypothetical protein
MRKDKKHQQENQAIVQNKTGKNCEINSTSIGAI